MGGIHSIDGVGVSLDSAVVVVQYEQHADGLDSANEARLSGVYQRTGDIAASAIPDVLSHKGSSPSTTVPVLPSRAQLKLHGGVEGDD